MRWWDIDAVVRLEHTLFIEDAWTPGLFWSELAQHDSRYYVVAEDGGHLTGYAGLAVFGAEGYVQTIGVAQEHWGIGLGTVLLGELLTEAGRRDATSIMLEVRADNDRAQRLYERFGFRTVGLRKAYYQPSGADARVMVRNAS
jgi:ribosomal-protein-alanine N-acetyltransferase